MSPGKRYFGFFHTDRLADWRGKIHSVELFTQIFGKQEVESPLLAEGGTSYPCPSISIRINFEIFCGDVVLRFATIPNIGGRDTEVVRRLSIWLSQVMSKQVQEDCLSKCRSSHVDKREEIETSDPKFLSATTISISKLRQPILRRP